MPDTSPPTEPQVDEVATDEEVFANLEHEAVASRLWIRALTRMAVPEPVSLCFHVTYAETQTNNLGVSLDAVS